MKYRPTTNIELERYMEVTSPRVQATLGFMRRNGLFKSTNAYADIGAGPLLLRLQTIGYKNLQAYDVDMWFKSILAAHDIPMYLLDCNQDARIRISQDVILLCEVIEHLWRNPYYVFDELRRSLNPGGALVVTSQNLRRLTQRSRLLRGKRLFDGIGPDSHWGHSREYVPEELVGALKAAGFAKVEWEYANVHGEPGWKARRYDQLSKYVPTLSSNFLMVAWV